MKRVVLVFILILSSFVFSSCGYTALHQSVFDEVDNYLQENAYSTNEKNGTTIYQIKKDDLPNESVVMPSAVLKWESLNRDKWILNVEIDTKTQKKEYGINTLNIPVSCHICETTDEIKCVCEQVPFLANELGNWESSEKKPEEFDIWDVKINTEIYGAVYFYAKTYDEFLKGIDKFKSNNNMYSGYDDLSRFDNIIKEYNDAFFADKNVFFYYKNEGNISENYLHSVVVKNGILTFNVNRFEGMATALSSWLSIAEIKKADVTNVTDYNVALRTISPLQDSISITIKDDYIRDVYVNGLTVEDFQGLSNLKAVNVTTRGLLVDIHFNRTLSENELEEVVLKLNNSSNVRTIGHTNNEWVRIRVNNKFYDKYMEKTLLLSDIVPNMLPNSETFTLEYKIVIPSITVTLEFVNLGKYYAVLMKQELSELNLPFVNYDYWY